MRGRLWLYARLALLAVCVACQAYTLARAYAGEWPPGGAAGQWLGPGAEQVVAFVGLTFNTTLLLAAVVWALWGAAGLALRAARAHPLLAGAAVGLYMAQYTDFLPPAVYRYRAQLGEWAARAWAGLWAALGPARAALE